MDYILNDKELLNVSGGAADGTNPYVYRAKEAVFSAFRVAQGLKARSAKLEDLLREAYLKLYEPELNVSGARSNLVEVRELMKRLPMVPTARKDMEYYTGLAFDALDRIK